MKTPRPASPAKLFIITPDGSETRFAAGPKATLQELQDAVSWTFPHGARLPGIIERMRVRFLGKVVDGYVHEEGLLHALPVNRAATAMQAMAYGTPFVGNLVIEARPGTKLYGLAIPTVVPGPMDTQLFPSQRRPER